MDSTIIAGLEQLADIALHGLAILVGTWTVFSVLMSALKTFVLPRSARDGITRRTFRTMRALFNLRLRKADTYRERDRIMALYAPLTLLILPVIWMILVMLGYGLIYWGAGLGSLEQSFRTSVSSLVTLGFASVETIPLTLLVFTESIIGMTLITLLIAYLPTIYSAFSKREALVAMLEVRAGSPPSVQTFYDRLFGIRKIDDLSELWEQWELWFTELEETHTSLAVLPLFRSPSPDRSWVTSAGAILDIAAFHQSTIDIPRNPKAALMIRAGFLALRHIADYFGLAHDNDPKPTDPISIRREEYDEVVQALADVGVPIRADRDQAWRDYAGWRVNYDTVLLSLAALTMAPYAPWSSDRSLRRPKKLAYYTLLERINRLGRPRLGQDITGTVVPGSKDA